MEIFLKLEYDMPCGVTNEDDVTAALASCMV